MNTNFWYSILSILLIIVKLIFCFYIRSSEKKKRISNIVSKKKFENLSIYLNNFVFLLSVKLINTLIGHSYAWYLTIERFFANESFTIETSYVSTRFSSSLITLSFFFFLPLVINYFLLPSLSLFFPLLFEQATIDYTGIKIPLNPIRSFRVSSANDFFQYSFTSHLKPFIDSVCLSRR